MAADLPSGAITFLFTDIEGSTRLLKQLREQYAEVLAERLRSACAALNGRGPNRLDEESSVCREIQLTVGV